MTKLKPSVTELAKLSTDTATMLENHGFDAAGRAASAGRKIGQDAKLGSSSASTSSSHSPATPSKPQSVSKTAKSDK